LTCKPLVLRTPAATLTLCTNTAALYHGACVAAAGQDQSILQLLAEHHGIYGATWSLMDAVDASLLVTAAP